MFVVQVSDTPYEQDAAESLPAVHYEFPNGYNDHFTEERLHIPEALFDPSVIKVLVVLRCHIAGLCDFTLV